MKRTNMRWCFLFFTVMSICGLSPAYSASERSISGVWEGEYECKQGRNGLRLELTDVTDRPRGSFVYFEIQANRHSRNGEFLVEGRYNATNRSLRLSPIHVISQPSGFQTVELEGNFSLDFREFSGRILTRGCGPFRLVRIADRLSQHNASNYNLFVNNDQTLNVCLCNTLPKYGRITWQSQRVSKYSFNINDGFVDIEYLMSGTNIITLYDRLGGVYNPTTREFGVPINRRCGEVLVFFLHEKFHERVHATQGNDNFPNKLRYIADEMEAYHFERALGRKYNLTQYSDFAQAAEEARFLDGWEYNNRAKFYHDNHIRLQNQGHVGDRLGTANIQCLR